MFIELFYTDLRWDGAGRAPVPAPCNTSSVSLEVLLPLMKLLSLKAVAAGDICDISHKVTSQGQCQVISTGTMEMQCSVAIMLRQAILEKKKTLPCMHSAHDQSVNYPCALKRERCFSQL